MGFCYIVMDIMMPLFVLKTRFGTDSAANPSDTRQIKQALNRLGYYRPLNMIGLTDIPDRAIFDALKLFQNDHGLPITGVFKPDDATMQALNESMTRDGATGFYIWRTVQDNRVRKTHVEREGHVFSWEIEPLGGHPGQDNHCRCWAEAYMPKANITISMPRAFEAPNWKADTLEMLRKPEHENEVLYPYLDSEGKITVGIGVNVNRATVFNALPFNTSDAVTHQTRRATLTEKQAAHIYLTNRAAALHAANDLANHSADTYRLETNLILTRANSEALTNTKIDEFEISLLHALPEFEVYPSQAKQALMDMMYNIGPTRFTPARWPAFYQAVYDRDWAKAALESHREGISDIRNTNILNLFNDAADLDPLKN